MIPTILLTTLLLSTPTLHPAQALTLHPSPPIHNTTTPPIPNPALMPRAIYYDIPNTELTLYISDLWRRIDNQVGHDLIRLATQEAQAAVTSGRGDLPLKPRCWAVEREGLRLQIQGGGPRTELTPRQMSYEILLETVKGLETFFSEVQGGYYLLFFFVLTRASREFAHGYGFGKLMERREGVGHAGDFHVPGCGGDGGERSGEFPVQVDRLVRGR